MLTPSRITGVYTTRAAFAGRPFTARVHTGRCDIYSKHSIRPLTRSMARGIQELEIYADFKQDESYTPNKISVRAGNSFHDLRVRA